MGPLFVGCHSYTTISRVSFDANNNNITLEYNYLIINFLAAWLKMSKIKVYYKKNELKAGFVVK